MSNLFFDKMVSSYLMHTPSILLGASANTCKTMQADFVICLSLNIMPKSNLNDFEYSLMKSFSLLKKKQCQALKCDRSVISAHYNYPLNNK